MVKKSNLIPFNGAYYTKDGNLRNLDGAEGPNANASDMMPFTGVFIGSDGAEHDISELFTGGPSGAGGHVILDESGQVYPQRRKLQFLTPNVEDDVARNATIVNGVVSNEVDLSRPQRPEILKPLSSAVDIMPAFRIELTEYWHLWGTIFKSARFQVATDADFTDIVYDRFSDTNTYAIDGNYILPNTVYYIRAKYIDIKDKESSWSETTIITTVVDAPTEPYYLDPVIAYPWNNGYLGESRFVLKLGLPKAVGTPTKTIKGIQAYIYSTPDLNPDNLITDVEATTTDKYVIEASYPGNYCPSPIYVDAAYRFSDNSLSPRSLAHLVWIQRTFKDQCIGLDITLKDVKYTAVRNVSEVKRIDRYGNFVEVDPKYFTEVSEVFNTITPDILVTNAGTPDEFPQEIVKLPLQYMKIETEDLKPTADNDYIRTRVKIWISPSALDDGFVAAPPFHRAPNGLAVSRNLLNCSEVDPYNSKTEPGRLPKSEFGLAGTRVVALDSIIGSNEGLQSAVDIKGLNNSRIELLHGSTLMYMRWLWAIENGRLDQMPEAVNRGYFNTDSCFNYRGIRCVAGINDHNGEGGGLAGSGSSHRASSFYANGYGSETFSDIYGYITFPGTSETHIEEATIDEDNPDNNVGWYDTGTKEPTAIWTGKTPYLPIDRAFYWEPRYWWTYGANQVGAYTQRGLQYKLFSGLVQNWVKSRQKMYIRNMNLFQDSYSRAWSTETYNVVTFGYSGVDTIGYILYRFQVNY